MTMLEARDVTVRYGDLTLVDGVSFTVAEGEWVMVCGPNGAGKSTLVNAIAQGAPYTGDVLFEGEPLRRMKPPQVARRIGVLAQSNAALYAFTVAEVVRLGRYAHREGFFARGGGGRGGRDDGCDGGSGRNPAGRDDELVREAIERTGLAPFAQQSVLTLSGGELQRAFLAQVFAQDPRMLILDEPTNHLDLVYQKRTFELVREWLRRPGKAVLSVTHDLSLARAYGSRVLLMDRARIVSAGAPSEALSPANLEAVYGMDVHAWMRDLLEKW
ncbi:MAG: ABC transporter ATP-binding protein [Clostridiales Family XIII bacterium]|jgi:iron complex transport system ATP-binding protein|nr:ABC transporter ATP-binding protein [Clostridiales Family XIII bacterium]